MMSTFKFSNKSTMTSCLTKTVMMMLLMKIQRIHWPQPAVYSRKRPWDSLKINKLATYNASAANVWNQFQHFLNDIQIFWYNQEGDLVTNFICQALQFAENTCHGLQDGVLMVAPQQQGAIPHIHNGLQISCPSSLCQVYDLVEYLEKRRCLVRRI
jgi:hypothetical protein